MCKQSTHTAHSVPFPQAKDAQLTGLHEERQALADELAVLKGMGGGSGVVAGAAAAELASLNLSGGDEAAMKAIEQHISAVSEGW